MKKYLGALSLVALFSLSSSLEAASTTNWTGVYGGVALGWGTSKGKGPIATATEENIKLRGWTYGLEFGGGAAVMPSLYLGANFSIDSSARSKKEEGTVFAIDFSGRFKEKAQYALTAQIGVPICNFMPFGEIGYNWGSAKYNVNLTVPDLGQVSLSGKGKAKELIFGGGVKWQPVKNVLVAVSYRHAPGKIKFKNTQECGVEKKKDYKNDSVRVSVSYLFNF